MTRSSAHFGVTRLAFTVGAVTMIAGIAGCAAPATSSPATPTSAVTDVASCEAFTDVSTIAHNAMAGLLDGRMTQQEHDGWMRLATRVLDRVPTRAEGAVSEAIAAMQTASPPVPAGGYGAASIDLSGSDTTTPLVEACAAAGYELFVEAFTGG